MSKGTTIKEAFANYEKKNGKKAEDAEHVVLYAQIPPIEKMDASLSTLKNCIQLSLSTNSIEKIANLNGLKCLTILTLSRNSIKSLTGLEAVGDTLKELWISYNLIEKLKGVGVLKKLQCLYMVQNKVSDMNELAKLDDLHCLEKLTFTGNPLAIEFGDQYRDIVTTRLKKIQNLDEGTEYVYRDNRSFNISDVKIRRVNCNGKGVQVIRDGDDEEEQQQQKQS